MIVEPRCFQRKCKNYIGIRSDGVESTERNFCRAFVDRIPNRIAYGKNLHLKPVKGDRGIRFEPIPEVV